MKLKTKLLKILTVNTKQRDSARKGVKALVYNEITEGEYKGWFKLDQLVPPKGAIVSVWTKEQEEYLDKRFLPLERDVKELKEDVKGLKKDMKEVKSNIKKILEMISSMNTKIDNISQQK